MSWVFWAIVVAALIHVAEEYWGGFLSLMQQRLPGVTLRQFLIINALLVLLCIVAAVVGTGNPVLSLSVASLILINAMIHIVATAWLRRYAAGVISSIVLYVPLGIYAFYRAELTPSQAAAAGLLGLLWMSVPLVYQIVRLRGRLPIRHSGPRSEI